MATKTVPRGKRGGVLIRTTDDLIDYWAERITQATDELKSEDSYDSYRQQSSIIMRGDTILHYGSHFPLATIIRHANGRARLVLLNGDRWSGAGFGPSTSQRQMQVAKVVAREIAGTRIQTITLPFSALESADIVKSSIKPLHQREARWVRTERVTAILPDSTYRDEDGYPYVYNDADGGREHIEQREDGKWVIPEYRHWLADSLFSATVVQGYGEEARKRRAKFLSSFDYNEATAPYFLCELPRTTAETVEEALEALKPESVVNALASGVEVLRQGDVFAIPTGLTTRELTSFAKPFTERYWVVAADRPTYQGEREVKIRVRSKHGAEADILNTNHRATHVIVTNDGDFYGRGMLYHDPSGWGRLPDHTRVKLGDGKTWYRLVKNTVPQDRTGIHHGGSRMVNQSGSNRAWTLGGNVD